MQLGTGCKRLRLGSVDVDLCKSDGQIQRIGAGPWESDKEVSGQSSRPLTKNLWHSKYHSDLDGLYLFAPDRHWADSARRKQLHDDHGHPSTLLHDWIQSETNTIKHRKCTEPSLLRPTADLLQGSKQSWCRIMGCRLKPQFSGLGFFRPATLWKRGPVW